jgi:hypothetical protein
VPGDWERNYGPWVKVSNDMPGFECAVLQTYKGEPRAPVMWRGKVCIRFMGTDLMDMEAALLESKNDGEKPYVAMPERSYESGGSTKYLKQVYIHRKELLGALSECIRMELGDSSTEAPVDDDDIPL